MRFRHRNHSNYGIKNKSFNDRVKNSKIRHSMYSHKGGNEMKSALDKGFVSKYSKRMIQKINTKDKTSRMKKTAYMIEEKQFANGENINLYSSHVRGDSDNIFPVNYEVFIL